MKKIVYDNFEYEISAGIGIVSFLKDGEQLSDLLALAFFAMYYAKKDNLANHFFITKEFSQKMVKRQNIKELLRTISYEKALSLGFQTQFDIKANEIVGAELLIHRNHKTGVPIERDECLTSAEEMVKHSIHNKMIFSEWFKQNTAMEQKIYRTSMYEY